MHAWWHWLFFLRIFHLDQISKESEEALRTEPVTMSNIKCKSLYFFEIHRSADEINSLNNPFEHLESLATWSSYIKRGESGNESLPNGLPPLHKSVAVALSQTPRKALQTKLWKVFNRNTKISLQLCDQGSKRDKRGLFIQIFFPS